VNHSKAVGLNHGSPKAAREAISIGRVDDLHLPATVFNYGSLRSSLPTVETKYRVPSCPKVLSCEIPCATSRCPGNTNCALSFDITNDLRNRNFSKYRQKLMDVTQTQMTFQNLALPLTCQFSYDTSHVLADPTKQYLPATFWKPNNVILAVPYRMT
jgi:hypothetical protein